MWRKTQKDTNKEATQNPRPHHQDARGWCRFSHVRSYGGHVPRGRDFRGRTKISIHPHKSKHFDYHPQLTQYMQTLAIPTLAIPTLPIPTLAIPSLSLSAYPHSQLISLSISSTQPRTNTSNFRSTGIPNIGQVMPKLFFVGKRDFTMSVKPKC